MHIPTYTLLHKDEAVRIAMIQAGHTAYTQIKAFTADSAWQKFVKQRFCALKPNRADYIIAQTASAERGAL